MFFCEPCRKYNNWPNSLSTSFGNCEMCNKTGYCHDVPSKYLPESRASVEMKAKRLVEAKMYDPKSLDTDIFGDVE